MTSQQLSRAVKSGDLIRLRPGFYVEGESRELPRHERHLCRCWLQTLRSADCCSHILRRRSSTASDRGLKLGKVAVCEESFALCTTSLTTFVRCRILPAR